MLPESDTFADLGNNSYDLKMDDTGNKLTSVDNPSSSQNHNRPKFMPSQELLNELNNNQANPVGNQPVPIDAAANNTSTTTDQSPVPEPSNSIYPVPSKGIGNSLASPAQTTIANDSPAQPSQKKTIIAKLIVAFGILITLIALSGLIVGVRSASVDMTVDSDLVIASYILYLLLGIGIIFKKEIARQIYIILAVLGLLLTIYTTYNYFSVGRHVSNGYANQVAGDKQAISNYQHNSLMSSSQKQSVIQGLRNQLSQDEKYQQTFNNTYNKAQNHLVFILIGDYALAILPLIFLTRPSVVEQFN